MRAIATPTQTPGVVYTTCVSSISDAGLRTRLNLVTNNVVAAAQDYEQRAVGKQLYTIPPNNSRNDDVVIGAVTKKELKDLYSTHMVGENKPARATYDQLLAEAPLGRCPFCGLGQATTLDHYLPKAKYPLVAVVPVNLVPACKDCNTGKSTAVATTENEQCLHPYFDHQHFITEQWLYAEIRATTPATIKFFVEPPVHWDMTSRQRVQSHFKDFKLATRYSSVAGEQLACLRGTLNQRFQTLGGDGVKQHLEIEANSYSEVHINSWQTAMFQALAASDWYCNGGFN
jgi:hypothetical protein